MDATSRIKNLSIALEALSQLASYGAHTCYNDVEELLKREIEAYKKEQTTAQPPARPAIPSPNDDIPF